MKMYLPFGDWSGDGHGRYEKCLIDAPSMEHLLNIQKQIKIKYGQSFFEDMAGDYEKPFLSEQNWQALIDTNYPIERFQKKENINNWDDYSSLQEVLKEDDCPMVSLDFVIDAFIWLLNAFGAEIIMCEEENPIPMICNWTCPGFKTVGYGCFE